MRSRRARCFLHSQSRIAARRQLINTLLKRGWQKRLKSSKKIEANGKINFTAWRRGTVFALRPMITAIIRSKEWSNIARQIGGENHGFRFIQLPFNLAMPEAYLLQNQAVERTGFFDDRRGARARRFGDVQRFDFAGKTGAKLAAHI